MGVVLGVGVGLGDAAFVVRLVVGRTVAVPATTPWPRCQRRAALSPVSAGGRSYVGSRGFKVPTGTRRRACSSTSRAPAPEAPGDAVGVASTAPAAAASTRSESPEERAPSRRGNPTATTATIPTPVRISWALRRRSGDSQPRRFRGACTGSTGTGAGSTGVCSPVGSPMAPSAASPADPPVRAPAGSLSGPVGVTVADIGGRGNAVAPAAGTNRMAPRRLASAVALASGAPTRSTTLRSGRPVRSTTRSTESSRPVAGRCPAG